MHPKSPERRWDEKNRCTRLACVTWFTNVGSIRSTMNLKLLRSTKRTKLLRSPNCLKVFLINELCRVWAELISLPKSSSHGKKGLPGTSEKRNFITKTSYQTSPVHWRYSFQLQKSNQTQKINEHRYHSFLSKISSLPYIFFRATSDFISAFQSFTKKQ